MDSLDHYLDDFILAGECGTNNCQKLILAFDEVCSELHVSAAKDKSLGPTMVLIFLGLETDTVHILVRIPLHKIEELIQLLHTFLGRNKISLLELQSLCGKLNFVCRAVCSGRPCLRRFYEAMSCLKEPDHRLRINFEKKQDFSIWLTFLKDFNGVVYFPSQEWEHSDVLKLYTDSSGSGNCGCGCFLNRKWSFFKWPDSWIKSEILQDLSVLEMDPVILAFMLWGDVLQNRKIILRIDNEALVSVINKQTTKSKRLLILIRQFVLLPMKYNIVFKAVHISSKANN